MAVTRRRGTHLLDSNAVTEDSHFLKVKKRISLAVLVIVSDIDYSLLFR